jgi:hypothetical protein
VRNERKQPLVGPAPVLVSVWRLLLGNVLPIGKRCS